MKIIKSKTNSVLRADRMGGGAWTHDVILSFSGHDTRIPVLAPRMPVQSTV